jgi:hypothetical protein
MGWMLEGEMKGAPSKDDEAVVRLLVTGTRSKTANDRVRYMLTSLEANDVSVL